MGVEGNVLWRSSEFQKFNVSPKQSGLSKCSTGLELAVESRLDKLCINFQVPS